VTLEYHRGKGATACPDEAAFRERAADSFEFDDPFVPPGASATSHMRVEITREGGVFRGTLSVVDASGAALASSAEEHVDCDALVWVLGHRVALAVFRKPQVVSAPPPAPAPAAPEKPAPPPPPQYVLVPACDEHCIENIVRRVAARTGPWIDFSVTLMAGGLLTAGWSEDVGPGAWLGFQVRHQWFSMGLEARALFPAKTLTFGENITSNVATFSGLLLPCAHWRVIFGCAFFEVGSYIFTVPGRKPAVTDTVLSVGPRAGIDIPIGAGFTVRGFADLAIHPYAPVFGVLLTPDPDGPKAQWQTRIVSGFFGLGVGWSR